MKISTPPNPHLNPKLPAFQPRFDPDAPQGGPPDRFHFGGRESATLAGGLAGGAGLGILGGYAGGHLGAYLGLTLTSPQAGLGQVFFNTLRGAAWGEITGALVCATAGAYLGGLAAQQYYDQRQG